MNKIMNVLVVGSSVIDLFLTIDKSHTKIEDNRVSLLLGDKIPSEIKKLCLGGNGANVSVGLTRITVPTTFYTYLGKDVLSKEIEEKLTTEGVELIAKRGENENSPLHLIFDFDSDRIIFSHYPKVNHNFSYEGGSHFDYVFLNSIADYWEEAYREVLEFARKNTTPIVFSPGSRQLDELNELVFQVIHASKFIFVNKEEAEKILEKNGKKSTDIKDILQNLSLLGPKVVSVTDGVKGAYALDEEKNIYQILPYKTNAASVDRTGAGDSYASGFLAACIQGQSVKEAMRWGAVNAWSVMSQIGAQPGLLTKTQIEKALVENNNFTAEKI
jgi:ribokinase